MYIWKSGRIGKYAPNLGNLVDIWKSGGNMLENLVKFGRHLEKVRRNRAASALDNDEHREAATTTLSEQEPSAGGDSDSLDSD